MNTRLRTALIFVGGMVVAGIGFIALNAVIFSKSNDSSQTQVHNLESVISATGWSLAGEHAISGSLALDDKGISKANIMLSCGGHGEVLTKIGVSNEGLDIATENQVHDNSYYDMLQGRTIAKVYTTQNHLISIKIGLDTYFEPMTLTPDTNATFHLDSLPFSLDQLANAQFLKFVIPANGQNQVARVPLKDGVVSNFVTQCIAYTNTTAATEKTQADAEAQAQIAEQIKANREAGSVITLHVDDPRACDLSPNGVITSAKIFDVADEASAFDPDNASSSQPQTKSYYASSGGSATIEKVHKNKDGVDDWYLVRYSGSIYHEALAAAGELENVAFEGWVSRDNFNEVIAAPCG